MTTNKSATIDDNYFGVPTGRKKVWNRSWNGGLQTPETLTHLAGINATLRELSDRTGMTISTLAWIFNGRTIPNALNMERIAYAIGCDVRLLNAVLRRERKRWLDAHGLHLTRCGRCAVRFNRVERYVVIDGERYHRACAEDIRDRVGSPQHANREPSSPAKEKDGA